MKFRRYTPEEKRIMVELYKKNKSYHSAAIDFGCAFSTGYYAVNPEAYEYHKEYVVGVRNQTIKRKRR